MCTFVCLLHRMAALWLRHLMGLMQEKVHRRIAAAKVVELNPPRAGKKCVVLDIDYTIFDLNSAAERPEELVSGGMQSHLAPARQLLLLPCCRCGGGGVLRVSPDSLKAGCMVSGNHVSGIITSSVPHAPAS